MSKQVAAHDFRPDEYPILITAHRIEDGKLGAEVWRAECAEPPGVLHIPPLAKRFGHPVGIRITFATGEVQEALP